MTLGRGWRCLPPEDHDRLCAWISHVPQMISTALAAALVEEFGEEARLLPAGGRALKEMTRISASPYSMWRDIAISNKKNIERCAVQGGAAAGAYPGKSDDAAVGGGV